MKNLLARLGFIRALCATLLALLAPLASKAQPEQGSEIEISAAVLKDKSTSETNDCFNYSQYNYTAQVFAVKYSSVSKPLPDMLLADISAFAIIPFVCWLFLFVVEKCTSKGNTCGATP